MYWHVVVCFKNDTDTCTYLSTARSIDHIFYLASLCHKSIGYEFELDTALNAYEYNKTRSNWWTGENEFNLQRQNMTVNFHVRYRHLAIYWITSKGNMHYIFRKPNNYRLISAIIFPRCSLLCFSICLCQLLTALRNVDVNEGREKSNMCTCI